MFSLGAGGKCWALLGDSLIPTWAPISNVSFTPTDSLENSLPPLILSNKEHLSRVYFPWFSTPPGPAGEKFKVCWWHKSCFVGDKCLRTTLQVRRSLLFEVEKGKGDGGNQLYVAGFCGNWIRNKQAQKLVSVLISCEQSWLLRCLLEGYVYLLTSHQGSGEYIWESAPLTKPKLLFMIKKEHW